MAGAVSSQRREGRSLWRERGRARAEEDAEAEGPSEAIDLIGGGAVSVQDSRLWMI